MPKLLIKTGKTNEHADGMDFAVIDLTPQLAQEILSRKQSFDLLKLLDRQLDELVFTDYSPEWYDWSEELDEQFEDDPDAAHVELEAVAFDTPHETQRTECDRMVLDQFGVTWRCYPKHCDWLVTTHEVDYATVEAAARSEVAA